MQKKYLYRKIEEASKEEKGYSREQKILRIVRFLKFVDIEDISKIIDLFEMMDIFGIENVEISTLLNILIQNIEKISDEEKERVSKTTVRQLEKIVTGHRYINMFSRYKELVDLIGYKTFGRLSIPQIDIDILNYTEGEREQLNIIFNVFRIEFYNVFFKYFSDVVQNKLISIFIELDNENIEKENIETVIYLMKGKDYNYRFTNTENKVYEYIISRLKQENEKGVEYYPDPKKKLISNFYNLMMDGYFKDITIDHEIKEELAGHFPEVDWVLCEIKTVETVEKLMKNRKFSVAKKLFVKTKEDAELFDKWMISKVEKEF